ncbi:DUF58 domain-containing protein [Microlunatus capsulatus]|uniref:Uncharacterized protein (DUF58 family) n=1 Tax=Microlunatus capsulatus TaxID=99117 RepID=A0ABS4ZAE0_9ACTN|nr:DUF58 domain-containing protein [Microlunatus capsulatus]MBP2417687.1 uncharacterized protein (DUF58 family) [Microlunatus capsulatus]
MSDPTTTARVVDPDAPRPRPVAPAPPRTPAPAPASAAWLVGGVLVAVVGLVAGRPEVAVLGLPLLLGLVVSRAGWPAQDVRARLRAADQTASAGTLQAELEVGAAPGVPLLGVRVDAPGHRPREALLLARDRVVGVRMRSVRTGSRALFQLDARSADPSGLLLGPVSSQPPVVMTVLPSTRALRALPLPFRLQGLTGPHGSRRAGDGGDLHDVAPFRPGDRLRRIDWRVTARINGQGAAGAGQPGAVSELYVRRTFATADATVMLVVDSRDEVGPRVDTWGDASAVDEDEATSLDLARTAAASVARSYLEAGDRVGLEDLGRLRRPSPPAGGRPHLHRLTQQLARARPDGEPTRRQRVPRLPSGALIVLFSTFLDDDPARLATSWRGSGHRVVAVDTLPPLLLAGLSGRQRTAFRVVSMDRLDRIADLGRAGVETVSWQSLDPAHDVAAELGVLARRRVRR